MPINFIVFEYLSGNPYWWFEIIEELSDTIVKNGHIDVWDTPGFGVDFIVKEAKKYLAKEAKISLINNNLNFKYKNKYEKFRRKCVIQSS